ncbi:MAG: hypothetical protein ACI9XO_000130 [Paraglaciecola sp.]|jgi:hypothetical protein
MKNTFPIVLICFLFLFRNEAQAQKKNVWSTLGMMKYERQFSEHDGINANRGGGSKFRPLIEALDGEEIEVIGYIIPLSGKKAQSHLMFSMYPFATCFFCGNAGPETVMEVFMKDDKKVEFTEEAITLKGKFKFLSNRTDDVMFHLEFAEKIED